MPTTAKDEIDFSERAVPNDREVLARFFRAAVEPPSREEACLELGPYARRCYVPMLDGTMPRRPRNRRTAEDGVVHVGRVAELWRWVYETSNAIARVHAAAERVERECNNSPEKVYASAVLNAWKRLRAVLTSDTDAQPPWNLFHDYAPGLDCLLTPLDDVHADGRRRAMLARLTPPLTSMLATSRAELLRSLVDDLEAWLRTWERNDEASQRLRRAEELLRPDDGFPATWSIADDLSPSLETVRVLYTGVLFPEAEPLRSIAASDAVHQARWAKRRGPRYAALLAAAHLIGKKSATSVRDLIE